MSKVVEQETAEEVEGEEVVDFDNETVEVEAEQAEEQPAYEIPEKFKDKSLEDVVKSYTELEKEFGRRNNELGELRKTTEQLVAMQLDKGKSEDEPAYQGVDVDTLLDDPNAAISKIIENNPKLKNIEELITQSSREKAKGSFESKHPDWQDVANTSEFQSWVQSNQTRLAMFKDAHQNFDYGKANDLFDWYKQTHQEEPAPNLGNAVTETGAKRTERKKIFRKVDLQRMRQYDPDKFDAMQPEIIKAYAEGRVR